MADRIQTDSQTLETPAESPKETSSAQDAAGKQTVPEQTCTVSEKKDTRLEQANNRNLLAEAKLAAVSLGVPVKRAGYAARLADLSNVSIDDRNGPDITAVQKAVETVLKDIPELKGTPDDQKKSGLRIGANRTPSKTDVAPTCAAARVKPWNKFRV